MLKSKFRLIIVSTLLFSLILASNAVMFGAKETDKKIIVFKNTVSENKKIEILKKHGAEKIKDFSAINGVLVQVEKGYKFTDENEISYIENDFVVSLCKKPVASPTPNPDPTPTPIPVQNEVIPWGIEYMNAPLYWDTVDTNNIRVGILDTGIDLDHPDLAANIKGGFNAIRNKKPYDDDNGHGTHVAGIIAAIDNDIGVIGMMPDADLFAIKSLDSSGNGYISDIIDGINWAISNNLDIINMSIGTTTYSQSLHDIIIQADAAGIKMVAAAGNNFGGSCEYPAAFPEVMSVGAIDQNGVIASFSAVIGVDVFAPGVDIYSTYIGGGYATMDGTSMACPHRTIITNK